MKQLSASYRLPYVFPVAFAGPILGAMIGAIAPLSLSFPALAQATDTTPLNEKASYVGTCRSSGSDTVSVFADTAQSKPVGTLKPFTRIVLTGVLGSGIVQITDPLVGWIKTDTLLTNCEAKAPGSSAPKPTPAPAPTPTPTPAPESGNATPAAKACFLVVPKEGLAARETPNGKIQASKFGNDGPLGGSQVLTTDPVERTTAGDRIWLKVTYDSANGGKRTGWISEGVPNGGKNIKGCE